MDDKPQTTEQKNMEKTYVVNLTVEEETPTVKKSFAEWLTILKHRLCMQDAFDRQQEELDNKLTNKIKAKR